MSRLFIFYRAMLDISIISLVLTQEDDYVAKVRRKTQLDVAKLSDPTLTGDIIVALYYPNWILVVGPFYPCLQEHSTSSSSASLQEPREATSRPHTLSNINPTSTLGKRLIVVLLLSSVCRVDPCA